MIRPFLLASLLAVAALAACGNKEEAAPAPAHQTRPPDPVPAPTAPTGEPMTPPDPTKPAANAATEAAKKQAQEPKK